MRTNRLIQSYMPQVVHFADTIIQNVGRNTFESGFNMDLLHIRLATFLGWQSVFLT